jgi:hypothetical protein
MVIEMALGQRDISNQHKRWLNQIEVLNLLILTASMASRSRSRAEKTPG